MNITTYTKEALHSSNNSLKMIQTQITNNFIVKL